MVRRGDDAGERDLRSGGEEERSVRSEEMGLLFLVFKRVIQVGLPQNRHAASVLPFIIQLSL